MSLYIGCWYFYTKRLMWSVMDVAHFQQHAFAYIVLFVGAGMLVLWEMYWSLLTVVLTFVANFVFYYLNSPLTFDEWLVNGGMLTMTVAVFSVFQIRTRYRLTFNEIKIRMDLELSKKEIESQKDVLEEKNQEITDSIRYAKSIQEALLPKKLEFETVFKDAFVFFQPKDIVSGDFYWIHSTERTTYYVTADCTGHGVPGGFMTMLGLSFLEEIIVHQKVEEPAEILNTLRERIISALNQQGIVGESKDGMDVTVCQLDRNTNVLKVASANNDVYLLSKGNEMTVIKADRQPCGYSSVPKPFLQQTIQLHSGDKIYTFTDGFADQFGGPRGKKFRYKQFAELLSESAHLPAMEQSELLSKTINDWKGQLDQVDDILVIGIAL